MNRRIKKILSLVVAVLMIMSVVPMTSFALTMCDVIGHDVKMVVTKEATCTEAGVKTEKCDRISCDYSTGKTEVIPLKSHTIATIEAVSPTCDKDGYTQGMYCWVCELDIVSCETIPALGHTLVDFPAVQPSCGVNGMNAGKKCSICNTVIIGGEPIIAGEHDYKQISFVAGSCKDGTPTTEVRKCKICGDTKTTAKPAECDFGAWITQSIATCSVNGKMTRTCSECGAIEEKAIDKIPHIYIKENMYSVEPTCELEGKYYGICSVCGDIKDEVVPAYGHKSEVIPGTPADCTLGGVSDCKWCTVCGAIISEPQQIPALGHDFVVDANTSTPATCEENGFEYLNCSRCKATDRRITVATGHSFGKWKVTVQPTCDKQGKKTRTCVAAGCGKAEIEYIESLGGHDVTVVPSIEATCCSVGFTQGSYCTKCNEIFEVQEVIPIQGHKMDWFTWVEPTCSTEGESVERCIYCNYASGNSYIIPRRGHNYKQTWQTIVQSTCTQTGVAIRVCKDCINIETITVDVIGHTDVNFDGKCDMCGVTGGFVAENCSCNCHKSGLANIFFKLMLFFQKIFRANATCKCGQAHY